MKLQYLKKYVNKLARVKFCLVNCETFRQKKAILQTLPYCY